MMASDKRKRSTNFSSTEVELLVDLVVNKYCKIIENKMTDSVTWKQKEAAWTNLSENFNAQSITYRSEKTLKMKYEGLKKTLKKKYAASKFEIYKTGGGEATRCTFENYENKLLSILSINVEGLQSEVDSDRNVTEPDVSKSENNTIVEKMGSNIADDEQIGHEDITDEPGPSGINDDMTITTTITETEIDERICEEGTEFKTPCVTEKGKKRSISWTPQTLKKTHFEKIKYAKRTC